MELQNKPVVKTGMLIRKPVGEVFNAFVDPEKTTKFWFTKSSGKLEEGKQVEWTWEMYNYTASVHVKSITPDKKIVIQWGDNEEITTVEWKFKSLDESRTFVSIVNNGFNGTPDELIAKTGDSVEGFTLVLAGLKAYLEHNIQLNLIADRFPKGLGED